jgi:hypothetical protein
MTFGVDTFRTHLDRVEELRTGGSFLTWNGNARPLFAGRNFLFGDQGFIWGHSEATSASVDERDNVPPPAGHASPEHPELLTLLVDRVAPIQAPKGTRQALTGDAGLVAGEVDADAICKRIVAGIYAGEFQSARFMDVWLSVDPASAFSAEYWGAWAHTVNSRALQAQPGQAQTQPFRAAIICAYVAGADGVLRPDPHVTEALTFVRAGMDTSVHGRWADMSLWGNAAAPADLAANGSPLLDWNRFDPSTKPVLWRVAGDFSLPNGRAAGAKLSIDAVNPEADPVGSMLTTQAWQPNVPTLQNRGFSSTDAVDAAAVARTLATPFPRVGDLGVRLAQIDNPPAGHFVVPGGDVKVVGRYIRVARDSSMQQPEAQRLSDANFGVFTIWQTTRTIAGLGPAAAHALDPSEHPIEHWGDWAGNRDKYIQYFNPDPDGNPATLNAGQLDGRDAFNYCSTELRQPSHTPVFFAIDFDPFDMPDPHAVQFPPPVQPGQPVPPDATRNWPPNPPDPTVKDWLQTYFARIRDARDALFARGGPYYLIGAYAAGQTLELLYEQGIVSHFWQATSYGHAGSRPPLWPWFHVNRWQFNREAGLVRFGWTIPNTTPAAEIVGGADADADWGDGGTWNLNDNVARVERAGIDFRLLEYRELLDPLPLPPP